MANKNIGTTDMITAMQAADTVLIETGGSVKRVSPETLSGRMNLQSNIELNSYGIEFDTTVSDPTCTRVGNMSLHRTLPIQSRMRGCILDDDGNVVEYLPQNSWVSSTRDGSKGQVMVEVPEHWRRCLTNGTKRRVDLAEEELPGFKHVPLTYVSAYEATVDRTNADKLKLCSVVNTTANFRGGNNDKSLDGTAKSQLGIPATSISLTDFRTYARNRKSGGTGWNIYTYQAHRTLFWLFTVEYATLNSQAAFNAQPTAEGYHQGGLGDGVTVLDWAKWGTFNGNNPFVPCGYTDELGNGTGVKDFTLAADTYDTAATTVSVPRYRGVENPFGHISKWTDGILIEVNPGDSGLSKVYTCDDPAKFSSTIGDGYVYIGDEDRVGGFIKEIIFGGNGDIIPKVCDGGSSSTYFCDNHYVNVKNTAIEVRGVLFGGNAADGAAAGFASARSTYAPSRTGTDFGSRLCFIA